MATPELDQVMFDAECMRLHFRGRMAPWQQHERAAYALRMGLDDSVVWMEPVAGDESPAK